MHKLAVALFLAAFLASSNGRAATPRSDGSILHVDFENYIDTGIGFLNAGVRWVGYPFSKINENVSMILNDETAFTGKRSGYVLTELQEERARIWLQRPADRDAADEIAEFVFRPVTEKAVDISDFVVWSSTRQQGGFVGLTIVATGQAASGTYDLRAKSKEGDLSVLAVGLKQNEWIRVILNRRRQAGLVDVWLGFPGTEKMLGSFPDSNSKGDIWRVEMGDSSESAIIGSGQWDDVRIGVLLERVGHVSLAESKSDVRDEPAVLSLPINVGKEKQLFVDDFAIQSRTALTRTFHSAVKHPKNPLIVPEKPWEARSLIASGLVNQDPQTKKWRFWYAAWGKHVGRPTYQCMAESDDGITWLKPDLGLIEHGGSKENNIVWDKRIKSLNFDPNTQDETRRYKGLVREDGFTTVYSSNGLQWERGRPVLEQAYDATTAFWDPATKKWLASTKVWFEGRRVRGYAESADFDRWTDTRLSLTHDNQDSPHDQLYHMTIVRYESIYVGPLKIYHTDTDRCEIHLAFSRNAKQWTRPLRTAFIPNASAKGSWDYGNMDQLGGWQVVGDEMWFYYGGRSTLHNESPNDGSLGLATLRLDGFASLDAEVKEGVLVTEPLLLNGKSLYINANAQGGTIRVEIIEPYDDRTTTDALNPVINPFLKATCEPFENNSVRHKVRWEASNDLKALQNKPVRLKFYLKNASLYAFWSE